MGSGMNIWKVIPFTKQGKTENGKEMESKTRNSFLDRLRFRWLLGIVIATGIHEI